MCNYFFSVCLCHWINSMRVGDVPMLQAEGQDLTWWLPHHHPTKYLMNEDMSEGKVSLK